MSQHKNLKQNSDKHSFKEKVDLLNHFSYNLTSILDPVPGALKFNMQTVRTTPPCTEISNLDMKKLNIQLKDDIYYTIGPFSHKKQIKLRSNYNTYLQYDRNGTPCSGHTGTIFNIEACCKTFKFAHSMGYLMAGKGICNFEVFQKGKNNRYSIRAGGKFIGISLEGKVLLFSDDSSIDTFWYIEDQSIDRSSYKVGPFRHGNWVTLQSVHNGGFYRYSVMDDKPFTDPKNPMPFFVEFIPETKKFRLMYYKGYLVCTLSTGFEFDIIENPNPEKNGYSLRSGGKCLGVSNITPGIVSLYDHFDYSETKWIVKTFDASSFSVGIFHHLGKVKLKSYYFRNYHLKTENGKAPSIGNDPSIFTCYQMGNQFKLLNGTFALCTDHANNNIFTIYEFENSFQNGFALGTGDPGNQIFLGCGNDGKINLYPESRYCETRWFPE